MTIQGESWGRRKDGGAFRQWQRVTTTTSDGIIRYAFVFNDVTERWQNQERAKHLALHDALTAASSSSWSISPR